MQLFLCISSKIKVGWAVFLSSFDTHYLNGNDHFADYKYNNAIDQKLDLRPETTQKQNKEMSKQ